MRKIILSTIIAVFSLVTASAQTGYEMVVEKTDGTKFVFKTSEISKTYFQEESNGNDPVDNLLLGDDSNFDGGTLGNWEWWINSSSRSDASPAYQSASSKRGMANSYGYVTTFSPGYQSNYCAMLSNYIVYGEDNSWKAQFAYKFTSCLEQGKTYKIQFYAKSSRTDGSLTFSHQNSSTYDHQIWKTFQVGEEWAPYEYVFTMDYNDVNQILFSFGAVAATYYIDNIQLGIVEGGTTPVNSINVVGTWNIVSGSYKRYENGVLASEESGSVQAPYDRMAFYDDGTFEFLEYSSSKGNWHEDGKGTYTMDGTAFVYKSGDWDYFEVTRVNNADEMEVSFQSTEDKVSTVVRKVYSAKLQRTTEDTPRGDRGGSDDTSGTFLGAKHIFGDNLLKTFVDDHETYTYHYDDDGFATQVDYVNSDKGTTGTYTASYGDNIVINGSSYGAWTASVESHGFIGSISYVDDKGNTEQVKFSYNDNEQLTSVDWGDGDVFSLTYDSEGDVTRVTNYNDVYEIAYETATQSKILNTGNVMEFDKLLGIDMDDFNALVYIGGFGKATKHLPLSITHNGTTTNHTWTCDSQGMATKVVSGSHTFQWEWTVGGSTIPENAVDLGLSVLWATCNVGATTPEENGNYYAWGETETKSAYSQYNYSRYVSGTTFNSIGSNISGSMYFDAATKNLGETWRMPTTSEMRELVEKCSWSRTTSNGVAGFTVTGSNGNHIFIPAACARFESGVSSTGSYANLWTSEPVDPYNYMCYRLLANTEGVEISTFPGFYGNTIRPVCKKEGGSGGGDTPGGDGWVSVSVSGYAPYYYCPTTGTTTPSTKVVTSNIRAYRHSSTGAYKVNWAGTDYACSSGYNKLKIGSQSHTATNSLGRTIVCTDSYYLEFTITN